MSVYAMFVPGKIKIGHSANVDGRIHSLQPKELIKVLSRSGGCSEERLLHVLLKADRIEGEWFNDTPTVRATLDHYEFRVHVVEGPGSASVRVDEDVYIKLKDASDKTGKSIKRIIRELVNRHLSKKEN